MREGTIPPNWTDLVQRSSQSVTTENIELKNTWFTTYHDCVVSELRGIVPSLINKAV